MQYGGETILPLHKRMNIDRKNTSGCAVMIDHFTNVCPNSSFSIQILEELDGNGYKNGARDKEVHLKRLDREDYWIKTLRTVYPYGLNDKVRKMNDGKPVGTLFPPLPRYGTRRPVQSRMKSPSHPFGNVEMFLEDIFNQPVSDRANYCRKELESLSLKNLRKLAVEADSLNSTCDSMHSRWYAMIKDVFFTKKFKPKKETKKKYPKVRVSVVFDNKGIDLIKLSSIINDPDVLDVFPNNGDESLIPSVIFKLLPPIRSKILNYTETVNSIDVSDNNTYGTGIHSCTCTDSPYCDPPAWAHNHWESSNNSK